MKISKNIQSTSHQSIITTNLPHIILNTATIRNKIHQIKFLHHMTLIKSSFKADIQSSFQ